MFSHSRLWFIVVMLVAALSRCGIAAPQLAAPYVWTDEKAVLVWPDAPPQAEYSIRAMTRAGWSETVRRTGAPKDGRLEIAPLDEGIHILELATTPPVALRFLAMKPPPTISRAELETAFVRTLPRAGRKLLAGEAVSLFSMGDSVANTGDYETMLAMMLARVTGNTRIAVHDHTYAGRSVDATVRAFARDVNEAKPDIGLLMYGLNEQIVFYPLEAYLEQYEWVAKQLAARNADTVFLQPTPHILLPPEAPWFPFRTVGFGEALRPVAQKLKVPLVETFNAVWGEGSTSVAASVEAMRPVYPPAYHKQMESLLEIKETFDGDTIHPNALGHLAIARATFDTLTARTSTPALAFAGVSRWTASGVQSEITVRNTGSTPRAGTLEIHAPPEARIQAPSSLAYSLRPGEQMKLSLIWPDAKTPHDLLKFPNDIYLASGNAFVSVLDFSNGGSRVHAVPTPFENAANWVRERSIVTGNTARVALLQNGVRREEKMTIPKGAEVGRIPLVKKIAQGDKTGWAVGELAFVRFGQALGGEAVLDGDLKEWSTHIWSGIGAPSQARWVRGPEDLRASPTEVSTRWAFKAGRDGIFLACRATGDVSQDGFTFYFDPRSPDELGSAGPYYWATVSGVQGGRFLPDGTIEIGKGETSPTAPNMRGAWKATPNGRNMELFVPYAALEQTAWPKSGDLGVSIWWTHKNSDGKITNLMWSENGHPWNPRWYGVVRRAKKRGEKLPYMVRVR